MSEWISVKDKNIPSRTLVVVENVNNPYKRCFVGYLVDFPSPYEFQINGGAARMYVEEITHWMPLPELPKNKE